MTWEQEVAAGEAVEKRTMELLVQAGLKKEGAYNGASGPGGTHGGRCLRTCLRRGSCWPDFL
jgi:hypothetical protein